MPRTLILAKTQIHKWHFMGHDCYLLLLRSERLGGGHIYMKPPGIIKGTQIMGLDEIPEREVTDPREAMEIWGRYYLPPPSRWERISHD